MSSLGNNRLDDRDESNLTKHGSVIIYKGKTIDATNNDEDNDNNDNNSNDEEEEEEEVDEDVDDEDDEDSKDDQRILQQITLIQHVLKESQTKTQPNLKDHKSFLHSKGVSTRGEIVSKPILLPTVVNTDFKLKLKRLESLLSPVFKTVYYTKLLIIL
ncbi:hypothetical protein M0802_005035 [Mischocyttarus mexicanus]|nr:hypothetical protein M0802_005035 [Mischocyttarus mexicanus]